MTLPQALPPVHPPTAPNRPLPPDACDAHVHIVAQDFPLWDGRAEDPAQGTMEHWVDQFRSHMATLGTRKVLLVHSILHGPDNAITLAATRALGPNTARAITLVADDVSDVSLDRLAAAHSVGVRLNYVHGGILSWDGARTMAPRLAARDMHIQMLLHTHLHMDDIADDIRALPVPLVIDHLGWPDLTRGVDDPGFQTLLRLVSEGHVWVKLSALYRLGPDADARAVPFVRALLDANPEACLWGSDWPHLMLADAAQPDSGVLLNALLDVMDETQTRRVFTDNPARLFRF